VRYRVIALILPVEWLRRLKAEQSAADADAPVAREPRGTRENLWNFFGRGVIELLNVHRTAPTLPVDAVHVN
jgi:hypothetical protein